MNGHEGGSNDVSFSPSITHNLQIENALGDKFTKPLYNMVFKILGGWNVTYLFYTEYLNQHFRLRLGFTRFGTFSQEMGVPQVSCSVTLFFIKIINIVFCMNNDTEEFLYVDELSCVQ